ncbi:unnamed protein product [Clonostachys rosea]|uniref:THH1/TOM1/TOM3 domain-containing protein n=1 Tax=Bionectria ochroleuca TaxID=29856 RepID=A0ABY6TQX1_BIOOC|nr:unnamed protein product [Clonostachys rosea]
MGYHGNKLSAIGLAFTSLALFIALINGAVSVIKLGNLGPQGHISARWIRASAFLVIIYLTLSLAVEAYLLVTPPWDKRPGTHKIVSELPEVTELLVNLAQAAILMAQFKLSFDLYSTGSKATKLTAVILFIVSQILNLTRFIAFHVALYDNNDYDLSESIPGYVYAVYVPALIMEVVLFSTSAMSVVVIVRYWIDFGATPNETAPGLLFAASAFSLLRHTWKVITSGISQITAMKGVPGPSVFPMWFFLIEKVLTHWDNVIVTTLLFCSALSGLRKLNSGRASPVSDVDGPIELINTTDASHRDEQNHVWR